MPQRLRLYDIRTSDFPQVMGRCASDVAGVASDLNSVQRRLLYCREAGDESWWGTWAEVAFNVDRTSPYITTPREIARLEMMTVCRNPIPIRNQFYEYLQWGNGRLPRLCGIGRSCDVSAYSRNNAVSFVDLNPAPQLIRIVSDSPDDSGSRVLIQGLDLNNSVVRSADGTNMIMGQFVTLEQPFVAFPFQMNRLTGIQKDITVGNVQFFQVDPTTGAEVLLLTMEPGEQTAWYRRYYLNNLPFNCCPSETTAQVTALAKLEMIPVQVDTDYCLIQNPEAIIEEGQSLRYSRIDNATAKQMAAEKHAQAVRLLNGELSHFGGKNTAAVSFKPFGSACLERVRVGMI